MDVECLLDAMQKAHPEIPVTGLKLSKDNVIMGYFPNTLTIAEKGTLSAFFSSYNPAATELAHYLAQPKIYDLVNDEVARKHFHDIDYTVEPITTLYPKRSFVEGEMNHCEWFSDFTLTEKIIDVSISYIRDSAGFALSRTTTRTWVNRDNTLNPETKITEKNYTINYNEMIVEGVRRRGNIIDFMKINVLGGMQQVLAGTYTPEEIIQKGRDFMKKHKIGFQAFIDESHKQVSLDIAVSDPDHDAWLDQFVAVGVTFRMMILNYLNI